MRKFTWIALLTIALVSCQDKTKKDTESVSASPVNSEIIGKAAIDFESNSDAERHRAVITEKYNELEVNFASYYIIATWGCGSGCVTGVLVDVRDGSVYSMPDDKEWGGNGTYIESKKDSRILATVAVAQSPSGEIEESRKYWEWNEELKNFKLIREESVLVDSNE